MLYRFKRSAETAESEEERRRRRRRRWPAATLWCCCCCILGSIAAVLVLSLIPLYLSNKGGNIIRADSNDGARVISMVFATNLTSNLTSVVNEYVSLVQKILEQFGYPPNTFTVQGTALGDSVVADSADGTKQQASNQISCENATNAVNQAGGRIAYLGIRVYIKRCPRSLCVTKACLDRCAAAIKSEILEIFSKNFVWMNIETGNGLVAIAVQFCSFGWVASGSSLSEPASITSAVTTTTSLPACTSTFCCNTQSCLACDQGGTTRYCRIVLTADAIIDADRNTFHDFYPIYFTTSVCQNLSSDASGNIYGPAADGSPSIIPEACNSACSASGR